MIHPHSFINSMRLGRLFSRILLLFARLLGIFGGRLRRGFDQFAFAACHRSHSALKSSTFITKSSSRSRGHRPERRVFFQLADHRIQLAGGSWQISLHRRGESLHCSFVDLDLARQLFCVFTDRGQLPLSLLESCKGYPQRLFLLIGRWSPSSEILEKLFLPNRVPRLAHLFLPFANLPLPIRI